MSEKHPYAKKIPASLVRPLLVGGAERNPAAIVFGIGGCFLALGWQFRSILAGVVGFCILAGGMALLRNIAERDPIMFRVFPQQIKYRAFHSAKSAPSRRKSPAKIIPILAALTMVPLILAYQLLLAPVFLWMLAGAVSVVVLYFLHPDPP